MFDANWMQIEEYLTRDDRIVLPTGSTEQHGYLSLGTDAILAERVAVEAAEPLGIPVLPALPFGMAPYFAAFPGSMSLRITTYVEVLRDLLDGLAAQGFRRIAIVNGHGGTRRSPGSCASGRASRARSGSRCCSQLVQRAADGGGRRPVRPRPDARRLAGELPWTGLPGVDLPADRAPVVSRELTGLLGPRRTPCGGTGRRDGRRLRAPGPGHAGGLERRGGRGPRAAGERLARITRPNVAVPGLGGKTAVVTGTAHGIGAAIAEALRGDGAVVYGVDRDAADLTSPGAVRQFFAGVGPVDILVNNAGGSDANALGSGLAERKDGGLTALGRRAVARMNKLGLAIAVSHSSDRTALDT